jgi:hypothetical protein
MALRLGRRLLERANGLATIAEVVVMTMSTVDIARKDLMITRRADRVMIWDRLSGKVLEVDDHGEVACYQQGPGAAGWEIRLVQLAHQVPMPVGQVQVTVTFPEHEIREAAAYARSRQTLALTPLERIGLHTLEAVLAHTLPPKY